MAEDGTGTRQEPQPEIVEEISVIIGEGMARTEPYHYDPLNERGEETWSTIGERTLSAERSDVASQSSEHQIWNLGSAVATLEASATKEGGLVVSLTSLNESVQSGCSQSVGDDFIFEDAISLRKGSSEFCRICHETGGFESFISPCSCRGSLSLVHKSCLERWLAESDSSHCELCGYQYRTERLPKHGLLSSIFAWLTCTTTWRDRRNLLIDIVALCIISPLVGLATMLALQLADSLFTAEIEKQNEMNSTAETKFVSSVVSRLGQMGVISMVITMDMAYISWVAMRFQFHISKWYTWYRRNCKVTLVGYEDIPSHHNKTEIAGNASSTTVRAVAF